MDDLQACKTLVRNLSRAFDAATEDHLPGVLTQFTAPDYHWRGMHPFYEQTGADSVVESFWRPLRRSLHRLQRRQDVFMAGVNDADGRASSWVCSMGHFMGLFDHDWLGIPATGKMAFLRYCEFHRVAAGQVAETALFVDIPGLMQQAGVDFLALQTGAALITPGPMTHDGLLFDTQDPAVGARTLALVNRMTGDLTGSGMRSDHLELGNTWHDDMIWYGPAGIGATYTRERYDEQHQDPFAAGLDQIQFNGHVARIAEGNYAGWFGWANLSMKASGGFLGMPASDRPTEMRVVDIYRRDGDRLAENWVFIDLLHFLYQQDLDVLSRMRRILRRRDPA